MRLLTFELFEKVQPDWFKKNPNFYLSTAEKELKKRKEDNESREISNQEYENKLKKLDINEIEFSYNEEWREYKPIKPEFLINNEFKNYDRASGKYEIGAKFRIKTEYNYKILIALIKLINKDTIMFDYIDKNIITMLFKELTDYYGLFFNNMGSGALFLTKNKEEYKNKISELKQEAKKIYYFNNKTKGKEFTDIELIEINKLRQQLKNIMIDDIYFTKDDWSDSESKSLSKRVSYSVKFKDKEINDKMYKYRLIQPLFFTREDDSYKIYFGHLKNRYHTSSIGQEIQGIGLGYKIYKAFLKFNGYMVSDQQTSMQARKIYMNLLKDDDVYYIVDKRMSKRTDKGDDQNKIMLIWKDYPKMEQLVRIVRTHELRNKRHYEYDKALLPYIKNISKKTI